MYLADSADMWFILPIHCPYSAASHH